MCIYIHTLRCVHPTHTGTQCAHGGAHPTSLAQTVWMPCTALPQPLQVTSWALGPWHSSPVRVPPYQCCTCQPGLPPPCPAAWRVARGQGRVYPSAQPAPSAVQGASAALSMRMQPCQQSRLHGKRWHSATSPAEPCAPVTLGALGQGPNLPPARAACRLSGQGWSRREKGSPGGMASLRASSLPSAVPSAAVTFCHGQRLPQARLAP